MSKSVVWSSSAQKLGRTLLGHSGTRSAADTGRRAVLSNLLETAARLKGRAKLSVRLCDRVPSSCADSIPSLVCTAACSHAKSYPANCSFSNRVCVSGPLVSVCTLSVAFALRSCAPGEGRRLFTPADAIAVFHLGLNLLRSTGTSS